ncbi:VCBS domain-containing protein [Aeromonas hydrophila]|uniref:VCBS domain-containing protein n=1 Tax=Aeromonas hydrophila TaxID=644 RepID=UPI003B75CCE7
MPTTPSAPTWRRWRTRPRCPLGSLTITEGGAWTYNVDNSKVEYLGEGETKVGPLWSSPWTAPSTPSPSPSPAPTTRRSSAAMPRAQ